MDSMPAPGSVELMAEIATPLDEWCEFCGLKLGVLKTADGVAACNDCATEVLEAMAKYEAEAQEAQEIVASMKGGGRFAVKAKHAKAKAKRRAKRKRTKR